MPVLFTPKKKTRKKRGRRKVSLMWKTLNCYWRAATMCEQLRAAPNNSESKPTAEPKNCERKLFISSPSHRSRRVDEVNDPRPFCLHRSLFAEPDQCVTFGSVCVCVPPLLLSLPVGSPCFDSVWERNTLWGVRWRLYVTDLEGKIKRRQTGS